MHVYSRAQGDCHGQHCCWLSSCTGRAEIGLASTDAVIRTARTCTVAASLPRCCNSGDRKAVPVVLWSCPIEDGPKSLSGYQSWHAHC